MSTDLAPLAYKGILAVMRLQERFGNDARTRAAFDELKDEILVETARKQDSLAVGLEALRAFVIMGQWAAEPEHLHPTTAHVRAALESVGAGFTSAANHQKEKMLFNAFFRSFDPRHHKAGMNRILLDIVRDLEYPEAWLLSRLIEKTRAYKEQHGDTPGAASSYNGLSQEAFLAKRLEALGLAWLGHPGRTANEARAAHATAMATAVMELVWDEDLDAAGPPWSDSDGTK